MVNQYLIGQATLNLDTDIAGEFPIYIYWPQCRSTVLYSTSIVALFNDCRVPKPVKVSAEGISFLLQSGVVPPPKTAYQDIYILGVGDRAKISNFAGKVNIDFTHVFPFFNAGRETAYETGPDESRILELLAEATFDRIKHDRPNFLFHSAGKDSNSIALALAEAGWQDRVTLITHKSKGRADESELSAKIARQLGFKHKVLLEVDKITSEHKADIDDYFLKAPLPSTDNVTLAYPLYLQQLPDLKKANLIDGGGNDVYMGLPPSVRDCRIVPLSKITHRLSFLRRWVRSESLISFLLRTPAEWCGVSGFGYLDSQKMFPVSKNVYMHWKHESNFRSDLDLFDFKTSVLAPVVASEMHIRKARNFADSIDSNLILPFANEKVAKYLYSIPERYLFDRQSLKNKLVLRDMLRRRLSLDSDAIGKMGWSYDSSSIVFKNWHWMELEVSSCSLWSDLEVEKIISRLTRNMKLSRRSAARSVRLLYRLYLVSAWYNKNRYVT